MLGRLMVARRFAPLFWCQFFSAFTDNFVKNVLVILILFKIGGEQAGALVTLAGAVFILPFFILSGLGGQMADRYDKAFVARRLKLAEIAIAAFGALGFALSSVPILFVALFGFGAIGALFGPIKYGILPDHLAREELPAANALVEGATFLAILTGTIAGGVAAATGDALSVTVVILVFALACWLTSLFIPATGEAAPALRVDPNIARSTAELLKDLWADTRLWRGGLVISWFWLIGAISLSLMPTLVKDTIGGTEEVVTTFLAVFSIAIAIGSLLAAWLAAGRLILLPTPVAALLMAAFALDLGIAASGAVQALPPVGVEAFLRRPPGLRIAIDLAGLAIAGGLFIVPYFAAVQAWAGIDRRARVVAAVNVLNAAFMTAGALVVAALQGAGVDVPTLFGATGIVNIVVAILIFRTLPTSAFKDLLSILFHAIYRVDVRGGDNINGAGPRTVFAIDHASLLDGLLMLSLLDAKPILGVAPAFAKRWWAKPFLRLVDATPVERRTLRALIGAVKAGRPLVVLLDRRRGANGRRREMVEAAAFIAVKAEARVVPVRIEGPDASVFSRLPRGDVRRRWFAKVAVTALGPVTLPNDRAFEQGMRRRVGATALDEAMSDLPFAAARLDRTLVEAVIEASALHGRSRIVVEDPGGALSYDRLLGEAAVIGRRLMPRAREGQAVGVMLPNGAPAATVILGLMAAGRVPALLDADAGAQFLLGACKAAEMAAVVTLRSYVESGRFGALIEAVSESVPVVYLEDLRASVGIFGRLRALLSAEAPIVLRKADDPAAILFTAGMSGAPTGSVLSHRNLLANAAQAGARTEFGRSDTLFNAVPLSHGFGLTLGFVLPLLSGARVWQHGASQDRLAPPLICGARATILLGDDTFLAACARAAHPDDLRSLREVLAAEPVKEATRRIYGERFGLRILEGFASTQALVIALNTPLFNRFGTVGRLLPGVEARLDAAPAGERGARLLVRGPNVMLGALTSGNSGAREAPAGGWHDTGAIVTIDGGFVTMTRRSACGVSEDKLADAEA